MAPVGAAEFEPDASKFPPDPAKLPARLENMRPGQIRDAAAKGAACLVPVGTLEGTGGDAPLGGPIDQAEQSLLRLAEQTHAVVAPPLWYAPTGYILSGPEEGTFDASAEAFADYLKEILQTLRELGFTRVTVVPLHNPQGPNGPMHSALKFVLGDLFNDFWRDPQFGRNWWCRPDRDKLPFQAFGLCELPKQDGETKPAASAGKTQLPLRLERMRPSEVRDAVRRGLPCFVPVGVLENHGNHSPIGCDAFEAQDPLVIAAGREPAVIAPAIWYGPTGNAVTGPKLGTTNISGRVFQRAMQGVVSGLAAMGFGDVIFVGVHQGGDGAEQTAVRMAIQQYRAGLHARTGYGPGWSRAGNRPAREPCNLEIISPPGAAYDHAGKNETSWMLFLRSEYTDLKLLRPNDYRFCWTPGDESSQATPEQGREMTEKLVEKWVQMIREKTRAGR